MLLYHIKAVRRVVSSYKFETLLFVCWYSGLEKDRVSSVLSVEERHVAVDLSEQVHALVSLLEV